MKLVLPDELSDEQKARLDSYRAWLPASAVCVNVMLGAEDWDVRPLIFEGTQVSLYRFSRELPEASCKGFAAEMEGFSAIPSCAIRVERRPGLRQFLAVRPYVPSTLQDQIRSGEVKPGQHNESLVQQVISLVGELRSFKLVHGHLCPSNVAIHNGELRLLDPLMGAINGTQSSSMPPETSPGHEVEHTSDLYGLGVTLTALLGGEVAGSRQQILKRLLLPSPKQRPSLDEVVEAFRQGPSTAGPSASGRVLRRVGATAAPTRPPAAEARTRAAQRSSLLPTIVVLAVVVGVAGYVVRLRYPSIYFGVAKMMPILAPERSTEFEGDWESGDRARMLGVARAAIFDRNPAAENAVVDSIMSGANPPDTTPRLMRVAFSDLWRSDLNETNRQAVIKLTLAPLLPQGLESMPPLSSLHPGVILAVAGQMPPNDPSPQLKPLPLSLFSKLPDPIGSVYRQLGELGVSSAGAPESVALAAITSGVTTPQVFDAFMGTDTSAKNVIARISIILPIIQDNDAATAQFVSSIRDRGGDIGQVLGWFDIEDLAKWSSVPGALKLSLALNKLPKQELSQAQYSDLLTFPLVAVREQAAGVLQRKFFKDRDTNLLITLSGAGNRLTREQTIALVAALTLEPTKRGPFIGAWFGLKPAPDTVLLLLLARSGYDSSDTFNLEAARYLRRAQWSATTEMLKLLAQHPEPLARTLAYARLDPRDDAQKKILQERISEEHDNSLLKMVTSKLSSELPSSQPAASSPVPRGESALKPQ